MTNKKFVIITLISMFIIFMLLGLFVVLVDPYFHYHKPFKNIVYTLDNERYQNDGIVKHFDYDAIITGTSMTENFRTSELDKLFDVNSIKVSYSGASFREINDNLIAATNNNKNIKLIVRCLDLYRINSDKDELSYDEIDYPTYLYDNNIFNDVEYLLNKDIIFTSIDYINNTINNESSTTFDDYASWYNYPGVVFSKENVDSQYIRSKKEKMQTITDDDYKRIYGNIKQNVTDLADKYPDIDFYLFYPPYSIYYWDNANQEGNLNMILDCIEYATKIMLEHKNIHIYSFLDEYDIINNLDNYKDSRHYSDKINSLMLQKIRNNEDIITKDNFEEKMKALRDYYLNYNYDSLFN